VHGTRLSIASQNSQFKREIQHCVGVVINVCNKSIFVRIEKYVTCNETHFSINKTLKTIEHCKHFCGIMDCWILHKQYINAISQVAAPCRYDTVCVRNAIWERRQILNVIMQTKELSPDYSTFMTPPKEIRPHSLTSF